jgi:MerR family transcriptional regulator, thiopeptide resistance regulator
LWDFLRRILEVIEMQNDTDWILKYYRGAAKEKLVKRRQAWSPELQERVSSKWIELIRDVEGALGESPRGEKGQALAGRWIDLVEEFTGADPDLTEAVKKVYADSANWPSHFRQQVQPFRISAAVWEFINQAIAERKRRQ